MPVNEMKRGQKVDVMRLCTAMQRARLALRRFREERTAAVKQYVGNHWGEEGAELIVPLNLIAMFVQVYSSKLVPKEPRVMLSTFQREHKAALSAMQTWTNKELEKIDFAGSLRRMVIDAFFSIGIMKVGLATPSDAGSYGWNLAAGEPFAEPIDLDDWVYDVHARRFDQVSFIGHRYRAPLDSIRDSTLYSGERKDLTETLDNPFNLEGDLRINVLQRGFYDTNAEEFEPHVDLWEVYLPRKRVILTLINDELSGATTQNALKPLRSQQWIGPDTGPYHILGLSVVPGNAMTKAPIQDLIDLHELINRLYRKAGNQAERQKTLLLVAGGATEDGNRTIQANDGDAIRSDNPASAKEMSYGAPHQGNLLFLQDAWQLFSKHAGNLELAAGLAPQSKTATQDEMLNQNSSALITSMQGDVVKVTTQIVKALCWYWWHHPTKVMRAEHPIPGLSGMVLQRLVHPMGATNQDGAPLQPQRNGRWQDLEIKIDPYSMQHATPQTKLAALNQVITQIVIPMQPLLQQQGIVFDLNAYLTLIAQWLDLPDLSEVVTIREPGPVEGSKPPQGGAMGAPPAETTRNYVRRSLGQDSEQAQGQDLRAQLMKGQANGQPQGAA